MRTHELLVEWRKTYAEWISTELQLRAIRRQKESDPLIRILEERIRGFKRQCSECQDALTIALASEHETSMRNQSAGPEQLFQEQA